MLVAGVALIAISFLNKNKGSDIADVENNEKAQVITEKNPEYVEGVLYGSDNQGRGNLMLLSDQNQIYIRTSRDFSRLIGLQVLVFIKGTLDNFELVDIQSKLEKDGFLLQQ